MMQVDSAWAAGNHIEAKRSANIAKILNFVGVGVQECVGDSGDCSDCI